MSDEASAQAARSFFRRCTTCKDPIAFEARYFNCSVSTCNRKRMTLVFCSVSCWEAHQADARHRDAGAEEAKAPTRAEWERETREERDRAGGREPERLAPAMSRVSHSIAHEVLVVTTRLKAYIQERAGMSTSDRVFNVLSDHVRELLDLAIAAAGRDGRKTVMDRDLEPLTRSRAPSLATGTPERDDRPRDIIMVVTKVKQYVKERSGMNTSDAVANVLSAHMRRLAREAIRKAAMDDRKTVLDRDVTAALARETRAG
jgi:histone H3/H4